MYYLAIWTQAPRLGSPALDELGTEIRVVLPSHSLFSLCAVSVLQVVCCNAAVSPPEDPVQRMREGPACQEAGAWRTVATESAG